MPSIATRFDRTKIWWENSTHDSKVIQKIGLCICVFDILQASDGRIGHGTGIVNVNGENDLPEKSRC